MGVTMRLTTGRNARDIAIVATAFNLLFEYSMRGVNHLVERPTFVLVLVAAYFTIFTMEEDLIRRFRLRDYHLVVLAFTYGMVYQCLVSGTAFQRPELLGIRWSHSLFVLLVWWGGIQSVLTFYLATRVCPRNWEQPPLSRRGWMIAAGVNLVVIGLFQMSGQIPRGTPAGYATMVAVVSAAGVLFWRLASRGARAPRAARPVLALDVLAVATVLAFAVCAIFLTSDPTKLGTSLVNETAVRAVVRWTFVAEAVLIGTRAISRRSLPV